MLYKSLIGIVTNKTSICARNVRLLPENLCVMCRIVAAAHMYMHANPGPSIQTIGVAHFFISSY